MLLYLYIIDEFLLTGIFDLLLIKVGLTLYCLIGMVENVIGFKEKL